MNKFVGIILIIIALTLSGVSTYLFTKYTDSSNSELVINNMENIYGLQKIDAAWSLATLQTLSVVESDFDQVAAFLPKFRELRNQLSNSELADSNAPAPLKNKLLAFLSLLEGKEQAIEQFKSNLAVTRNSIKYLPLAEKSLEQKASEMKNRELALRVQVISEKVNDYLKEPDSETKTSLLEDLSNLDKNLMDFPADIVNPLSNYISHASVLIERKEPMNRIVTRVTDDSVSKAGSELIELYKGYYGSRSNEIDRENSLNNIYKLSVTVLLGVLALISGAYVVISSGRYNAQLKDEVLARTSELERKANAATDSVVGGHHGKSMNTMDAMVASLAHEINTPLGYVSSNLEVLQSGTEKFHLLMDELKTLNTIIDEPDENRMRSRIKSLNNAVISTRDEAMLDEFPDAVKDISEGIDQIRHVIQELKDFSRKDRLDHELFSVNQCVDNALKMSRHQIGNNIKIVKSPGDVPEIYGSQADINQVMINLISNASLAIAEAERPQGIIKITTNVIKNQIVIDIQDNGKGMDKSITDKIFDPFFTTRDVGKGTGLGLAIVQKIVRQNDGKILVKSEPGKGTLFRVTFPARTTQNQETI